jgi:hypothetical protein
MIPNDYPGSRIFPGSRDQKSTGSRIRIRNSMVSILFFLCLQVIPRPAITPTGWTDRTASKFLSRIPSDSLGKNGQQNFSRGLNDWLIRPSLRFSL